MKTKDWSTNAGAALLLLMLFALPMLSGCTVLGYGIGALVDIESSGTRQVSAGEAAERLETGTEVTCVTTNGNSIHGTFAGIGVPGKDSLLAMLPGEPPADCEQRGVVRMGDVLVMKQKGLDADTVVFVTVENERLFYRPLHEPVIRILLFVHIEKLTRCGGRDIAPPYQQRVQDGMFERATSFRLMTVTGLRSIHPADIGTVYYENKPATGRIIFGTAGLAADITIVVAAAALGEATAKAGVGIFTGMFSILPH